MLLALCLAFLPFQTPPTIHAQQPTPTTNPACELIIDTIKPDLFCAVSHIEFKPGDSNITVDTQNELAKRAKVPKIRPQTATLTSSFSSPDTILYSYGGQCIPFARTISGKPVYGSAGSVSTNSDTPEVGGVLITWESRVGHAAVVTAVHDDSIEVIEANKKHGKVTTRTIALNARFIKGYVN